MDVESIILKYGVILDPSENLECPWITSLEMLIQQQRMTPISDEILDLRDQIFRSRSKFAFSVGQFANFWSYYDGFLRKTQVSAIGDKIRFGCNWRGCPAFYSLLLIEPQQFVLMECFEDHYHSVMDAVYQLAPCTLVRYQVLDILAQHQYPMVSVVLEHLSAVEKSKRLRSGLARVDGKYVEGLASLLSVPKRSIEGEESKLKRLKVQANGSESTLTER